MYASLLDDQKAEFRQSLKENIESLLTKASLSQVEVKVFDDGGLKIEVTGSRSDLIAARPLLYKYAGIVSYRTAA